MLILSSAIDYVNTDIIINGDQLKTNHRSNLEAVDQRLCDMLRSTLHFVRLVMFWVEEFCQIILLLMAADCSQIVGAGFKCLC